MMIMEFGAMDMESAVEAYMRYDKDANAWANAQFNWNQLFLYIKQSRFISLHNLFQKESLAKEHIRIEIARNE